MILRLEKIGQDAERMERAQPEHLGTGRRASDAAAVGPEEDVAAAACQGRESDALLGRHPAECAQNTVGQRQGALLFQKLLASKIRDRLRIEHHELNRRRLFEYPLPGVDPVGLGFKRARFYQRLRSDVLQHFPVPVRLAARHVDGIRAKVVLRD